MQSPLKDKDKPKAKRSRKQPTTASKANPIPFKAVCTYRELVLRLRLERAEHTENLGAVQQLESLSIAAPQVQPSSSAAAWWMGACWRSTAALPLVL